MKKSILFLLVVSLLLSAVGAASAERRLDANGNAAYEYENRELWDLPLLPGGTDSVMKKFADMGNNGFDLEKILNSEYGEVATQRLIPWTTWRDPMDPGLLSYWENVGVKKERKFVAGTTAEDGNDYYIYTPVNMDETKKYPLVFACHGAGAPARVIERFGWCEIAAREQFILVSPTKTGADNIHAIAEEVKSAYPVDATRVYISGTSAGGRASRQYATNYPYEVAAAAPMNNPFVRNPEEEGDTALLQQLVMPMIYIAGTNDYYNILPIGAGEQLSNSIENWNNLMELYGFDSYKLTDEESNALLESTTNLLEYYTGVRLPEAKVINYINHRSFKCDFVNEDGSCYLSLVIEEDGNHLPTAYEAEYAWAFMSRFARAEDGALILLDK